LQKTVAPRKHLMASARARPRLEIIKRKVHAGTGDALRRVRVFSRASLLLQPSHPSAHLSSPIHSHPVPSIHPEAQYPSNQPCSSSSVVRSRPTCMLKRLSIPAVSCMSSPLVNSTRRWTQGTRAIRQDHSASVEAMLRSRPRPCGPCRHHNESHLWCVPWSDDDPAR